MAAPLSESSAERRPARSRRQFLKRAAAFGAAGLVGGLLTGCGGEENRTRPDGEVQTPTGDEPKPGLSEEVVDCRSTEQLSPQDLKVRQALNYTPDSPEPGETCGNCRFYTAPQQEECGGCELFPGPVVAGGWCTSWAIQQS